jgi:membrane-associated PAP2 superfamily phosphatase
MEGQGYKHKLFHLNLQCITSVLEKFEYLQGCKLPVYLNEILYSTLYTFWLKKSKKKTKFILHQAVKRCHIFVAVTSQDLYFQRHLLHGLFLCSMT